MTEIQQITPEQLKNREEFVIFVERFMHFMNLWTVYTDFLSDKYLPSVGRSAHPPDPENWSATDMGGTLMFVLYGFFYSLIEDSDDALNGFRVWRQRFPEEETAISAVEAVVSPLADGLRLFRNRLGFHGSRSRKHESRGLDVFSEHSGDEVWNAMKNFKALGAALLAKENARNGLPGFQSEPVRHWIDAVAARSQRVKQSLSVSPVKP